MSENNENNNEERIEMLDWESYYQEELLERMPWHFNLLDYDVKAALSQYNITAGSLLDIGTGSGTQAVLLSGLGFDVTATDISPTAIGLAKIHAKEKDAEVNFLVDDIRDSKIEGTFDLIVDRGTFHTLHAEERDNYVEKISSLLKPGGHFFLKTYSKSEDMWKGPYKFDHEKIRDYFEKKFKVILIVNTEFEGTIQYYPMALFAVMQLADS